METIDAEIWEFKHLSYAISTLIEEVDWIIHKEA
jgi:hypothetical protein